MFFETLERLVADDTDNRNDVYERANGATTLVSTGSTGGNAAFDAFFYGASADGSRRAVRDLRAAHRRATPIRQSDVYERSGGATTLVSTGTTGGNGPQGAFFDGASADGVTRVLPHDRAPRERRHRLAGGRL